MAGHFAPLSDKRFPLSANVQRGYLPPQTPATQQRITAHLESTRSYHLQDQWGYSNTSLPWSQPTPQRHQVNRRFSPYSPLRNEYQPQLQSLEETIISSSPSTRRAHEFRQLATSSPRPSSRMSDRSRSYDSLSARREDRSRSASSDSSAVKVEQEDGGDCFIMEFSCGPDAEPTEQQPYGTSGDAFPRTPGKAGRHSVDIRAEVPIRAGGAPEEMRKLMHILRLDPFTMHNGVDRGIVAPVRPEPGPLTEEPIMFEFQLELTAANSEELEVQLPSVDLRAFPPDFEVDNETDDGRWTISRNTSTSTTSDQILPTTPPPPSWDLGHPTHEVDIASPARLVKPSAPALPIPPPSYPKVRYEEAPLPVSTNAPVSSVDLPNHYDADQSHIQYGQLHSASPYSQDAIYAPPYAPPPQPSIRQSRSDYYSDPTTTPWAQSNPGYPIPSRSSSMYSNVTSHPYDVSGPMSTYVSSSSRRWAAPDPVMNPNPETYLM